ncbi:MAG TPA: hypothetical protein VLL72_04295 [Kiloniellales bacterium]|nr:hypothetical protein [Kiloniellales bacterium]
MDHRSTRAKVRDQLIPTLARVGSGSRELDIVLCYVVGDGTSPAEQMIRLLVGEGYPWDIISELLDEELPAYTRSLDAALPGEDIGLALRSPRRGRWAALQRGVDGRDVLAWAATECLARRQAALKALAAEPRPRPRPPRPEAARAQAPRTTGRAATTGEPEAADWKILF